MSSAEGMSAPRLRSGSPSIAVHSTSNRKLALPDLPDRVDLVDVLGPRPAHPRGTLAPLAVVEPVRQVAAPDAADLLPGGDPGAHPQAVADVHQVGHDLAVLVRPAQQVVRGDDPVGVLAMLR